MVAPLLLCFSTQGSARSTSMSGQGSLRAVRTASSGTSSRRAASGPSSSAGSPQWPSSHRLGQLPARTRVIAVLVIPSFIAIASAIFAERLGIKRADAGAFFEEL